MLYAETSAVLRWLLGQELGTDVRRELQRADRVAASCLTVLECQRVLCRLAPELEPKAHAALRTMLFEATRRWLLVEIDEPVRRRAGEAFPLEPIRALDAIHLASALIWRERNAEVSIVATHDLALGAAARSFGFDVRGL